MSKDKYPSIFSRQMKAIVFIALQIFFFFTTRAVLKIGEYHSDILQFQSGHIQSRDVFKNFCLYFKTFKESLLLSIFCQLITTGAKACKELQLYEEATKWCCDGLAVSFTNAITNNILFLVPPFEFLVLNHQYDM